MIIVLKLKNKILININNNDIKKIEISEDDIDIDTNDNNNIPKKKNTILGEVGQRISGGQKQRIGIARAMYSDSQILILDVSTSNLDNDRENQILRK